MNESDLAVIRKAVQTLDDIAVTHSGHWDWQVKSPAQHRIADNGGTVAYATAAKEGLLEVIIRHEPHPTEDQIFEQTIRYFVPK